MNNLTIGNIMNNKEYLTKSKLKTVEINIVKNKVYDNDGHFIGVITGKYTISPCCSIITDNFGNKYVAQTSFHEEDIEKENPIYYIEKCVYILVDKDENETELKETKIHNNGLREKRARSYISTLYTTGEIDIKRYAILLYQHENKKLYI